jgi:hypothetical protein
MMVASMSWAANLANLGIDGGHAEVSQMWPSLRSMTARSMSSA